MADSITKSLAGLDITDKQRAEVEQFVNDATAAQPWTTEERQRLVQIMLNMQLSSAIQQHNNVCLFLVGVPASGKTVIANFVSRRLEEEGVKILFVYGDIREAILAEVTRHRTTDLSTVFDVLCCPAMVSACDSLIYRALVDPQRSEIMSSPIPGVTLPRRSIITSSVMPNIDGADTPVVHFTFTRRWKAPAHIAPPGGV